MRSVGPPCKLCQLQLRPLSPVNQRCAVCTTKCCASCIVPQGLCHKLSATWVPCHKLVQCVPQAGPPSSLWLQLPFAGRSQLEANQQDQAGNFVSSYFTPAFLGVTCSAQICKMSHQWHANRNKKCPSLALWCACHCLTGYYRVLANSVQCWHQVFSAKAKIINLERFCHQN